MKTLQDCFGHQVRLTDERLAHILEHPEMKDMGTARQAATKPRSPVGARPRPDLAEECLAGEYGKET